jgi:competence protein ComGC
MPRGVNIFEPSLRTGVGSQLERRRVSKSVIKSTRRSRGFTLLELMIVLSVLRQNLDTLNKVIEAYRLDKRESPQTLDDLVTAGYLHQLPNDPMTGHPDWATEQEDSTNALDPQQSGIFRVHSASTGTALNGEAYSTW